MADIMLKKLRKLEANMICPNCGTRAQAGIGFGNVCVKFKTFICDSCKTSHQAISHRVKSITMSNWTSDEVNELTDQRGGGNNAALHIWLQNSPPVGQRYSGGKRPQSGDNIDIFKKFIADCYELGRFKSSTPYIPPIVQGTNIDTSSTKILPSSTKILPSSNKILPSSAKSSKSSECIDSLIHYDEDNSGRAINLPLHNDTLQQLGFFEYGGLKVDETPPCSPEKTTSFANSISDFDPFGQSNGSYTNSVAAISSLNAAAVIDPFADTPSGDLFFGMSPPKKAVNNPTSAFPFVAPGPLATTEFSAFTTQPPAPVADPFGGASVLLQPTVLHQPNPSSILPTPVPAPIAAPALASSSSTLPMKPLNNSFYPAAMNYSAQPSWGGMIPPPAPGPGPMNMNAMNGFYSTGNNAMNMNMNTSWSAAPTPFYTPQPTYNSSGLSISQMNIPAAGYRGEQNMGGRPMATVGRSVPPPPQQQQQQHMNDSFNFVAGAIRSQLDSTSNKF
eukprot:gene24227-32658_t